MLQAIATMTNICNKLCVKKIAIIVGTRPEIIKVAPIYLEGSDKFSFELIATGQHAEMADQAFSAFNIKPDINLNLMKNDQSALSFLNSCIAKLGELFANQKYSCVLVQGDTSTALAGALAAFHFKIPVAHLEAGLRTNNKYSPFPEEMNRSLISKLADFHFCPTKKAKQNLLDEGLNENVFVTGNSVVDAVKIIREKIKPELNQSIIALMNRFSSLILVTGHRRENFDLLSDNLCKALIKIRDLNPDTAIIFPVHPNPNVKEQVYASLSKQQRIFLTSPLDYGSTLNLMALVNLIITDSGGIQEEAPCFGTPVIITREATERSEAIENGFAELCPLTKPEKIIEAADKYLNKKVRFDPSNNPFGTGDTAKQVLAILSNKLN